MDVISSRYTKVYALDWYEYGCKVHKFGYSSCVAIFNIIILILRTQCLCGGACSLHKYQELTIVTFQLNTCVIAVVCNAWH